MTLRLREHLGADFAYKITSSRKNADVIWGLDSNYIHDLSIVAEDDETIRNECFKVGEEGDDMGWLGRFIGQCTSLFSLYIGNFPADADQRNKFLEGLNRNRSIQILTIGHHRGVDEMLEKLSSFFLNNKSFCKLELEAFDIGDESAGKLASTICDVPLKDLSLCGNILSNEGFETIVTAASSVQSRIESLCVRWNHVDQVGCTTLLQSGALNKLKDLDLGYNSIDDNSLQTLAAGLVNNTALEQLSLCGNQSITANGLRHLVPFLQSESCSLSTFFLYRINFGDAGAAVLAHGLGQNKSLKRLWFDPSDCGMTSTGWQSFVTLLCDASSINNTYQSNHTIELIGELDDSPVNQDHERVRDLLRMNENANSREIANCKILLYHRDLDVEPMFKWDLKFLPLMVTWFGKIYGCDMLSTTNTYCSELSVVYKFISGMPALTAAFYWQKIVANAQIKMRRIEDEMRWLDSERLRLVHEEEATWARRRRMADEMRWLVNLRLMLFHEEEDAWIRLGGRPRSDGSNTNRVSGTKRMRQE